MLFISISFTRKTSHRVESCPQEKVKHALQKVLNFHLPEKKCLNPSPLNKPEKQSPYKQT